MTDLKLFVPGYEKEEDLPLSLIKDAENKLGIKVEIKRFTNEEGDKLKFGVMLPISVSKKIGIKQTRRTKSLYTQLLVYLDGEVFTFYPQSYAQREITIEDFLSGLLNGDVSCLHDKKRLEEEIKKLSQEK